MLWLDDRKLNTWQMIKSDIAPNGVGYSVKYCLRSDGYINIGCNRNGAELCMKVEDIYNGLRYIQLLLSYGFINEVRGNEKNISTHKINNQNMFEDAFGDKSKYFHGNNWWESDLICVKEFLVSHLGIDVLKKYTGDRLKEELNKLSINCLDMILKEVGNEKGI